MTSQEVLRGEHLPADAMTRIGEIGWGLGWSIQGYTRYGGSRLTFDGRMNPKML
jgi:hypothetical protein